MLKEWQKRMIEEIEQLEERLKNLNKWLEDGFGEVEKKLSEDCDKPTVYFVSLIAQRKHMTRYLHELKHQRALWMVKDE